jgi:hypothetical protein
MNIEIRDIEAKLYGSIDPTTTTSAKEFRDLVLVSERRRRSKTLAVRIASTVALVILILGLLLSAARSQIFQRSINVTR